MNHEKIGSIIKERRIEKGLTQVELADKLRVSNRTISKWENGNSLPDYSMFNDICKVLDLSINDLIIGKKDIKKKKNILLIILISLLLIMIIYKFFITYVIYKNHHDKVQFPKNVSSIKIKNNKLANNLIYDEINIYVPKDFIKITDKEKTPLVSDTCTPYIKGLKKDKSFASAIIICKDRYNLYSTFYNEYNIKNTIIPYLNIETLFEKYNIYNIVDLIKFYEKNKDFKQNIFTSSDDIKINYLARTYITNNLVNYDDFYYLEGDLNGYLMYKKLNKESSTQDIILSYESDHREVIYSVSLINYKESYFNKDNTLEIINSIYRR